MISWISGKAPDVVNFFHSNWMSKNSNKRIGCSLVFFISSIANSTSSWPSMDRNLMDVCRWCVNITPTNSIRTGDNDAHELRSKGLELAPWVWTGLTSPRCQHIDEMGWSRCVPSIPPFGGYTKFRGFSDVKSLIHI